MKTLQELLREADPLRTEKGMSDAYIDRIRRATLSDERAEPKGSWPRRWVIACACTLIVAIAVALDRRSEPTSGASPSHVNESTLEIPVGTTRVRRQLQFATPGGTRVIWVFDSNFEMR